MARRIVTMSIRPEIVEQAKKKFLNLSNIVDKYLERILTEGVDDVNEQQQLLKDIEALERKKEKLNRDLISVVVNQDDNESVMDRINARWLEMKRERGLLRPDGTAVCPSDEDYEKYAFGRNLKNDNRNE